MKTLIVDFSPIIYRWIFSTTTEASQKLKLKKQENGIYDLDDYRDIFLLRIFDDISKFRRRFEVDEIVLAIDTKPYWRKKFWSGYKYGRFSQDQSGIDWVKVAKIQEEILKVLKEHSSFKVINLPGCEGDDVGFVLSEYLSKKGHEVIVKSVDHDWRYNLLHENVTYWQTKHMCKSMNCKFVEAEKEELEEEMLDHCIYGDKGDYILSIVAYSQFSKEFKEKYPNMTELKAYPKRHEIDVSFKEKYGKSAYKHPRFGKVSFEKKHNLTNLPFEEKKKKYMEFIKTNKIYEDNFKLNEILALPEGIPESLKSNIIDDYEKASVKRNNAELTKYFMKNNLINLVGNVGLL